ncbi:MAG: hypothetical protein ACLP9Y_00445 [Mycobacterium sp.]
MADDPPRSRTARQAAEQALVRVVHHYGAAPEFVLLGGLVPELLCSSSGMLHAGTTDVDVQVDLEIAAGAVNTARLERALANAEFTVDPDKIWRWRAEIGGRRAVVKFELLADLDSYPTGAVVRFDACEALGAVNLRGTGFAVRDYAPRAMRARIGGVSYEVNVNVAGLAGFLLAKVAAAYGRRKEKDWYDIAFVLLHNDAGGPEAAAHLILDRFGDDVVAVARRAHDDLRANIAAVDAQGPAAYASQLAIDHPELDPVQLPADAVVAVRSFYANLVPDND